jgi:hypothetical protein
VARTGALRQAAQLPVQADARPRADDGIAARQRGDLIGQASFWRKLNSGRRRRWRSGIARRRWRGRDIAGADLHRPPRIADDATQTVVHRSGAHGRHIRHISPDGR